MSTVERLKAADLLDIQPNASERSKKRQHWPKDNHASETPNSHGYVIAGYSEGLVMDAMPSQLRGMMSVFGVGLLGLGLFMSYASATMIISLFGPIANTGSIWLTLSGVLLFVCSFALALVCLVASIRVFRVDLSAPREAPLIFNRKTRKVYRYSPEIPGFEDLAGPDGKFCWLGVGRYILKTFLPWPNRMLLVEYDWNCLEAEFYRVTAMAGKVLRTDDHLDLYVREAPGSDKVIGSFALIPSIATGETVARDVWEHVRRFMEEGGPLLNEGDQPGKPPPRTFWQALNRPLGPGWLLFLAGAIWTADIMYWDTLYIFTDPQDPASLQLLLKLHERVSPKSPFFSLIQYGVAYISYFAMAWIIFHILGMYLASKASLPDDLIVDLGEPVDLSDLLLEQHRKTHSVPDSSLATDTNKARRSRFRRTDKRRSGSGSE